MMVGQSIAGIWGNLTSARTCMVNAYLRYLIEAQLAGLPC